MKVYGITHCDTVKKARAWLDAHGVAYEFIDLRRSPPEPARLRRWCREAGRDALVNRRGTTWRSLDEGTRAGIVDDESAVAVMAAHPTLVKRPVVEAGDALVVGFDAADYARRFASEPR
jgi:Spx/MgsR family transcriptional regulator